MSHQNVHCSVPLVLFAVTRLQLGVLAVGLFDEVSIAQPGDFGPWVRMDVRLQDQDGRFGLFQLGLFINPEMKLQNAADRSAGLTMTKFVNPIFLLINYLKSPIIA